VICTANTIAKEGLLHFLFTRQTLRGVIIHSCADNIVQAIGEVVIIANQLSRRSALCRVQQESINLTTLSKLRLVTYHLERPLHKLCLKQVVGLACVFFIACLERICVPCHSSL